jgi:hypothetical protein
MTVSYHLTIARPLVRHPWWPGVAAMASVLASIFLSGCYRESGAHDMRNETQSRLNLWKTYVCLAHELGVPISKCQSAAEAIEVLRSTQIPDDYEYERLEVDSWGNPFEWRVDTSNTPIRVFVTSLGPTGQGDSSLSIEIDLPCPSSEPGS